MKYLSNFCAFLLIIFSLLLSCKQKTPSEIESSYLANAIEKLGLKEKPKWIVILPGLGCHGCIEEGEVFIRENINNDRILFILTKVASLKILQQKTGLIFKNYSNVFVDNENKINIPTDNSIYPCIIRMEDDKLKNHEFQSPTNSQAFSNLKKDVD